MSVYRQYYLLSCRLLLFTEVEARSILWFQYFGDTREEFVSDTDTPVSWSYTSVFRNCTPFTKIWKLFKKFHIIQWKGLIINCKGSFVVMAETLTYSFSLLPIITTVSTHCLRTFIVDKSWRQIFFKPFELTILVVNMSISRNKKCLPWFPGGHFLKGLDNKIIGFVHI